MGLAFVSSQSATGTCTLTQAAAGGVTWNLTSLSVSMAGPTGGASAKLTIYDGAVGGTILAQYFLTGPGTGSVGSIQEIPIPKNAQNLPGLQATTGSAMNIQVVGTGANAVSINARFTDGLP